MRALFAGLALLLCSACGADTPSAKPDGSREAAALCSCPTGCCASQTCLGGNEDNACGTNGNPCVSCEPPSSCKAGRCEVPAECSSASCAGCCLATKECNVAPSTSSCGSHGAACRSCDDDDSCTDDACSSAGECTHTYRGDNQACQAKGKNGICHGGACCTGCWNDSSCEPGNMIFACGSEGGGCSSCTSSIPCTKGKCCLPDGTTPATMSECCSGGVCGCTCATSVCKASSLTCVELCVQMCGSS